MRNRQALAAMRPRTALELERDANKRLQREERRAFWLMCATWAVVLPALFIVATGG